MTTTAFLPVPIFRAFDSAGNPLAGGLLYTYAAGTTTPLATYSDAAGVVPNANPVVLDSTGSATVRLGTSGYKFVLKDSSGTTQWTEDNYLAGGGDSPVFAGTVTAGALHITGNEQEDGNLTVTGTLLVSGQTTLTGDTPSRGIGVCRYKAADTARISTTTLANDPDLSYVIPSAGTYQIELMLSFSSVAGGAGFKWGLTFTSAIAAVAGLVVGNVNTAAVSATGAPFGSSQAYATVSTANNAVYLNCAVPIGASGTLNVLWAQNSSTASNTTLFSPSFLKVTKLS